MPHGGLPGSLLFLCQGPDYHRDRGAAIARRAADRPSIAAVRPPLRRGRRAARYAIIPDFRPRAQRTGDRGGPLAHAWLEQRTHNPLIEARSARQN
ncbi:hypothetical protein BN940_09411 [Castellaniella defragrans 65Phen]|uniref:Uncharacterized protein n=1 Tax=Castellaniella defragrans (strain DSM 12143 / CCUG 39792 / 65Phen) TaxID=1437824 RepID=W8X3R0_CASD6|nr:hypothetical protein BN940_09411 [Castellaniella defragrans 65Phen]